MQNPWKGLAAYKEPKPTDDYTYLFCGRESASAKLAELIESSLFVTLYGRTGIGKTSLLEAGVYPLLRNSSYIPVSVRLGIHDESQSAPFARLIVDAIESEIKDIRQTTDTGLKDTDVNFLWEYFATRHFFIDGSEVYPTIVLDQFEENFISASEKTWTLLRQLYSLIDDNKTFPEGYHNETIFRIVISIREDDLFRMEDCIDQLHLTDFKFNRYRLTYLTASEASEVITVPGGQYLPGNSQERQKVVSEILKIVKDGNDGCINTLTLSLVCSILFDKISTKGRSVISFEDVTEIGRNPLRDFYLSIVSGIPRQRHFIENRLVDSNGRRNSVNEQEMDTAFPNWRAFLSGRQRILQCSNHKVELVHDMLAKAIYDVREGKEKKKRSRALKISIIASAFIMLALSLFSSIFSLREEGSRIPLFPIKTATVDNSLSGLNHVEYLTVTDKNESDSISDLYNLSHLKYTSSKDLSISNCPELVNIQLDSKHVGKIDIYDCPNLRTLILPEGKIDGLTIADARPDLKIVITNPDRHLLLDGVLWDLTDDTIVYVENNKHSAAFPYRFRNRSVFYFNHDSIINNGHWIDNILFNHDSTAILASHRSVGPVLDLSKYPKLRRIASRSFSGRSIRKIIIDIDDNFPISEDLSYENAFEDCKLDSVVFGQRLLNHYFLRIPQFFRGKITYVLNDTTDRFEKRGGILYYYSQPLWVSSEYPHEYYLTESDGNAFRLILSYGFRVTSDNNGIHVFGDFYGLSDTCTYLKSYLKNIPWVFSSDKHNDFIFFTLETQTSDNIFIPRFYKSGSIDLRKISPYTKTIHISQPIIKLSNIPDTIKARTTLAVPYGKIEDYLYKSQYYGFNAIVEENLASAIYSALTVKLHAIKIQYTYDPLTRYFFLISIPAIWLILFVLSYIKIAKKRTGALRKLLYSLFQSVTILIFTALSWTGCYWLFFDTFNIKDPIISTIIASLFAITVILSIYHNIFYLIKTINWRRSVRKFKVILKRKITKRHIITFTASAALIILIAFLISGFKTRRDRYAVRVIDIVEKLHDDDNDTALLILTDYLGRHTPADKALLKKMDHLLVSLADEAGYRQFKTGNEPIEILISPDGQYIATRYYLKKKLGIWGTDSCRLSSTVELSSRYPDALSFSNGNRSITEIDNGDIFIHSIVSDSSIRIDAPVRDPDHTALNDDGSMAAYTKDNRFSILQIDYSTNDTATVFRQQCDNKISGIYFSQYAQRYCFTISNNEITQWDIEDRSVVQKLKSIYTPSWSFSHPQKNILFYDTKDAGYVLQKTKSYKYITFDDCPVYLSTKNQIIGFSNWGTSRAYIKLFNENKIEISNYTYDNSFDINSICVSPDNDYLYIAGDDNRIRILDISKNRKKAVRRLVKICEENTDRKLSKEDKLKYGLK